MLEIEPVMTNVWFGFACAASAFVPPPRLSGTALHQHTYFTLKIPTDQVQITHA